MGDLGIWGIYLRSHSDLEQFGGPDQKVDLDPRRCDLPCGWLDHLVLCRPGNTEEIAR
jgi:hypothetical protein